MPRTASKCRRETIRWTPAKRGTRHIRATTNATAIARGRFEIGPAECLEGRQRWQRREPVRQFRRQFQPGEQAARCAVQSARENEAAIQTRRRKAERLFAIGEFASLPARREAGRRSEIARARNRPTPARIRSPRATSSRAGPSKLRKARAKDAATISRIRPTARAASASRTATRALAKRLNWPPWESSARLSGSAPRTSRAK